MPTEDPNAAYTALQMFIQDYDAGRISRDEFDAEAAALWPLIERNPFRAKLVRERIKEIEQGLTGTDRAATVPAHLSDADVTAHIREHRFANGLRFSASHGWHVWMPERHVWVPDARGYRVRAVVQHELSRMLDVTDHESARNKLGSKAKRDAVNDMLATSDGTYQEEGVDPWDKAPHLLASPSGVIDLRHGKLTETSPDQFLTKSVATPFVPGAKAPRWERFLREVFPDNPEMPAYLQRLLGYGITGEDSEQCFAIFHGSGANGKSVLLNTLRMILGPHAVTVPFDMFTGDGKRGGPETEHLRGARMALASETNRSAVLDSAAIKNATGGEELNCNPKFRDPFTFKPIALILLATNYKPIIKEVDDGTWRRIKLVEFGRYFEPHERDRDLMTTLAAEAEGILAWLVEGARLWYESGLQDPDAVRDAVQNYRDTSDPLAEFLNGRIVVTRDPKDSVSLSEAYAAYIDWAEREGLSAKERLGRTTFGQAMEERGARKKKRNTGVVLLRMKLAAPDREGGAETARIFER